MRKLLTALFALCALASAARGQAVPTPSPSPTPLPNTDIFVADVTTAGGALKLGTLRRVTEWEGYDNQPSFTPDGRSILYTSIRADNQADTYRYNFSDNTTARLTETAEAEYSPTVMPDGKSFSVVRVEKDATQRLWKFPLAGGGAPALVLEKFEPVGYHAWADERTLALFILGQPEGRPATLQVVDVPTLVWGTVATNVGRSLQRRPATQRIAYVHKQSADEWWIKEYDTKTHAKATLVKTLPGSEDFAWTPDGAILMAKGSKLFVWRPGADWQEVADFASEGLTEVTRVAVSPRGDRLALVARTRADR